MWHPYSSKAAILQNLLKASRLDLLSRSLINVATKGSSSETSDQVLASNMHEVCLSKHQREKIKFLIEQNLFHVCSSQKLKFTENGILIEKDQAYQKAVLENMLGCVKVFSFDIEAGIGNILQMFSAKNVLNQISRSNRIKIIHNLPHGMEKKSFTAIGLEPDVRKFQQDLENILQKVLVKSHIIPLKITQVHSNGMRTLLQYLNQWPNTHAALNNRELSIWTSSENSMSDASHEIQKFFSDESSHTEEMILTSKAMGSCLRKFSSQGNVNLRTLDKTTAQISVMGSRSAVSRTVEEIRDFIDSHQQVDLLLSRDLLNKLRVDHPTFWRKYAGFRVHIPDNVKDPVIVCGPHDKMNSHLLELFHIARTLYPRDSEKSVVYEWSDKECFSFAADKLETIVSEIEVKPEIVQSSTGMIKVRLTSSNLQQLKKADDVMSSVWGVLKYRTDNANIMKLVRILQSAGKIDQGVSISKCSDGLLIRCDGKSEAETVRDVIRNTVNSGLEYHNYQSRGLAVVLSEKLRKELKAVARYFEVVIGKLDPDQQAIRSVEYLGNDASSYRFRQYLSNKFDCHVTTQLCLPSDERCRKWCERHLTQLSESWEDTVLFYDPETATYHVGSDSEIHTSDVSEDWRRAVENIIHSEILISDAKIGVFLRDKIEDLASKFPTIDLEIKNKDIELIGPQPDIASLTTDIEQLLSSQTSRDIVIPILLADNSLIGHTNRVLIRNCGGEVKSSVCVDGSELHINLVGDVAQIESIEQQLLLTPSKPGSVITQDITLPCGSPHYQQLLHEQLGIQTTQSDVSKFRDIFPDIDVSLTGKDRTYSITGNEAAVNDTIDIIANAAQRIHYRYLDCTSDCKSSVVKFLQEHDHGPKVDIEETRDGNLRITVVGTDKKAVYSLINDLRVSVPGFTLGHHKTTINYGSKNEDRKLMIHFEESKLAEEMRIKKRQGSLDYVWNDEGSAVTLSSHDQAILKRYSEKMSHFVDNFATEMQLYENKHLVSRKLKNQRLRLYTQKRWPGVKFDYNVNGGSINFWGDKSEVAEAKEFLGNFVEVVTESELVKWIKNRVILYDSVFTVNHPKEEKVIISGYKPDVEAVLRICEHHHNNTFQNAALRVDCGHRVRQVPTAVLFRILPSSQFKHMLPQLQYYAVGEELRFIGPQKQIADAQRFFDEITDDVMEFRCARPTRNSTLLTKRFSPATGRDEVSAFLDRDVFRRVFMNRANEYSEAMTTFGTPDDLAILRDYLDNTVPHKELSVTSIPLAELHGFLLKDEKVYGDIFQEFADEKVGWSITKTDIEIAGEEGVVSQLSDRVRDFLSGIHIEVIPSPDPRTWDSFSEEGYKKFFEESFPEVTLYNRYHTRPRRLHIVGPKSSIHKARAILEQHFALTSDIQQERIAITKNASESGLRDLLRSNRWFSDETVSR